MSFRIALSGLAAAQASLDVTANNIANANTNGFKQSRAEFTDVYATADYLKSEGVEFVREAGPMNAGTQIMRFLKVQKG